MTLRKTACYGILETVEEVFVEALVGLQVYAEDETDVLGNEQVMD